MNCRLCLRFERCALPRTLKIEADSSSALIKASDSRLSLRWVELEGSTSV